MAAKDELMATIRVGYKTYCMPIDDAVVVAKALASAEMYESRYRSKEEGGTTHHVYPNDNQGQYELTTMNPDLYRMARLAGKS